jgi:proline iminopeptidase
MMDLREVKTDKFTLNSGHLDVGGGHKVYFEQWGNKNAKTPILFFHGGPGSWYKPKHKIAFEPEQHQVIFFDQRGIGNSIPYGKLENNTTQTLIQDAVKILDHLDIERVFVFGGSWGSTLALLFTIEHQSKVEATIINGVFTGSSTEIDYLTEGRGRRFYPEAWEQLVRSVPDANTKDPYIYNARILLKSDDPKKLLKSAKALEAYDLPVLFFDWQNASHNKPDNVGEDETDFTPYMLLAHYLLNDYFLPENYILEKAKNIHTPLYIIQGRYDMACPPLLAYNIHKNVKNSKIFMTLGSHDTSDPENRTAIKTLVETVFI